jgi:excisionase family DNA binding protein
MTLAPEQLGFAVDPALRKVKLLTLAQVAELLGVDRATVYRWRRKKNPLPTIFLPGGTVRVPLAALERWIADEDEAERRAGAC